MDITDRILSELQDECQSPKLDLRSIVDDFRDEILYIDRDNTNDIENQMMKSQYAYIKFGLMLEAIRNKSWWNRWSEKFRDFREFCQKKVNLNIWQVANAIKSAQVAVKLSFMGFDELPRNASQALKLAELSPERLGDVWEGVLGKCEGHKITADAIAQEINPDAQPMRSSLMLPVGLVEKLSREAVMRGISVGEYIQELIDLEQAEAETVEPVVSQPPVDDLIADLLDPAEVVAIEPVRIVKSVATGIDRMRQAMYDRYLPKWKMAMNDG